MPKQFKQSLKIEVQKFSDNIIDDGGSKETILEKLKESKGCKCCAGSGPTKK